MNNKLWWIIGIVIVVIGLFFVFSNSGALFSPSLTAKNSTNSTNSTRLPDLTITLLNASVFFQNASGNVSYWYADISASVKNIGQASASVSKTSFVVTGFQRRDISTSGLAPGQTTVVNTRYLNLERRNVTYFVNATADGRFEIRESNENNNVKSTSFFI